MNNKIMIGSIISFLFLFGMVNAQSITVPSNIYANSTFPITISGLSSPNNTIGMIMIDVAGNSYPVVYTNTTANAFGFINSTGNYSITASEFVNNSTSQIASINISVLANPSDMLQASLSNLSNSTNDSLLSVNSAITNVSDNVSILNTSIASINGTVQSSLSVMQSNINGVDANVSSIASELQNNATAISQENNLIVSYMNNTNTELSQVGVDLSNINTSMTNTNNLQGEYNILFVVVDIVIITVFSYMFWKSGKNKSKEETTIEKEILKQVKKEKEKEISEVIKAKENATKFNVLKKGKKEIENEMLKKQFANDTELKRLRDEYLNVKASASKNNIPEEALPEFIAYKNYMKKTYKISINKDEDIVS